MSLFFLQCSSRRRGFSLIELLAVLAVVSVVAAASIPAINGFGAGLDASSATLKLATSIEQARQYATANNTYVYLSVLPKEGDVQRKELWVAIAASNSGADLSERGTKAFNIGDGDGDARQLGPVMKLKGFIARGKDEIPTSVVQRPDPALSSDINNSGPTFSPVAGRAYPISFWFAPDGSVGKNSVLQTRLEFAIQPDLKTEAAWASVIQIAGLTGSVQVFRAN